MKKHYEALSFEIIRFGQEDVITASAEDESAPENPSSPENPDNEIIDGVQVTAYFNEARETHYLTYIGTDYVPDATSEDPNAWVEVEVYRDENGHEWVRISSNSYLGSIGDY